MHVHLFVLFGIMKYKVVYESCLIYPPMCSLQSNILTVDTLATKVP